MQDRMSPSRPAYSQNKVSFANTDVALSEENHVHVLLRNWGFTPVSIIDEMKGSVSLFARTEADKPYECWLKPIAQWGLFRIYNVPNPPPLRGKWDSKNLDKTLMSFHNSLLHNIFGLDASKVLTITAAFVIDGKIYIPVGNKMRTAEADMIEHYKLMPFDKAISLLKEGIAKSYEGFNFESPEEEVLAIEKSAIIESVKLPAHLLSRTLGVKTQTFSQYEIGRVLTSDLADEMIGIGGGNV